jgi:hypothetical protein
MYHHRCKSDLSVVIYAVWICISMHHSFRRQASSCSGSCMPYVHLSLFSSAAVHRAFPLYPPTQSWYLPESNTQSSSVSKTISTMGKEIGWCSLKNHTSQTKCWTPCSPRALFMLSMPCPCAPTTHPLFG